MIWHWLVHRECNKRMPIDWFNFAISACVSPDAIRLFLGRFMCHEEVELPLNLITNTPNEAYQIAFDGFSIFIAELVITRIRVWSCLRSKICHKNENRSKTVIITSFEAEVCTWWNFKFCTYSFERWRVIIVVYLIELKVTWKSRFTLNSSHLKENPSSRSSHIRSDLICSGSL